MKTRILTAILAIIIYLPFLVLGNNYYLFANIILSIFASKEIFNIIFKKKNISILLLEIYLVLYIFLSKNIENFYFRLLLFFIIILFMFIKVILSSHQVKLIDILVSISLTIYASIGFYSLDLLRNININLIFFILITIWVTDSMAYFGGMKYGKNKLSVNISPKKTIEGSCIGTFSSLLVGIVFYFFTDIFNNIIISIFITFIVSILGQIGDLIESAFKREYNVKDSGNILPGHGGILDRFDSLILASPFLLIIVEILR